MENLELVQRLKKDIKDAAKVLSADEARFLVDAYYQMQDNRIRSNNQVRSMKESEEPNLVLQWLADQSDTLESNIKSALLKYVESSNVGCWLLSVYGIGPIIAAGMLAHIDITKVTSAGNIWRYAGLDPTSKWEKGQKRPWNASLKTLCWKAGQSFMKFHKQDECFYGKIYEKRKQFELQRSESGEMKEYALERAAKVGKSTEAFKAYSQGKLPPGQIDARARRYAVKLFLAHLFEVWYQDHHGKKAPLPYPIVHLGHVDYIPPPRVAAK